MSFNKHSLCGLFLLAGSAACSQVAAESFLDEIAWVPQLGVQYKQLEFEQDIRGLARTLNVEMDADLPSLSAGLAAVYRRGYVSLKYEGTYSNVKADSQGSLTNARTPIEAEREDYSITAGYRVWRTANVFAGYLVGETTLTPLPRCPLDISEEEPVCGDLGSAIIPGSGNRAHYHYVAGLPKYEQTYREDGWFVGASYAWNVFDTGTLSVSFAYAFLESRFNDNFGGPKEPQYHLDLEGDADGFSLGLAWSQPLSQRMGYFVDLRTQQYEATTSDDSGLAAGSVTDTKETMTTLTLGVQWYL
ncbi:hypothetical protein E4634_14535 [Mangrovimicrobium sediminis]|uniref:Uncharacterized protein n=1 Tax=Mangrovimicrobium sediminis TaxID=2562682 RepID=A0A4Z0LZB5_9GAMM|nr:hypothetical protein [Haliea sp. SAOS-164]TGD72732.1 hypothetical protein E4634_14535 [Haliea sp. SAOS-164]